MKWIFLAVVGVVLMGCSAVLPSKDRTLEEFIPTYKEEKVASKVSPPDLSFAEQNFPKKCEWVELVRVVDGDTIKVKDGIRVRFVGIDTPETRHPTKGVQPFGPEASARTKKLLKNSREVCLISDPAGDAYDRYGRRLAYVFSKQGVDLSAVLLQEGFARGYFSFPFGRKEEFKYYQNAAKEEKRGLWGL